MAENTAGDSAEQLLVASFNAGADESAARIESLERERNTAQANYQFMVERAADRHLEGYRELGAKCAAAEERAERAEAALAIATAQVESLAASLRQVEAERDALRMWREGYPPHPYDKEWFIAVTTFGDRVVLRALPEEYTYDFKTADDTYIKRDKINLG